MEQIVALPSAGPHERAVARIIGAIEAFLAGHFELLETGMDEALSLVTRVRIGAWWPSHGCCRRS